MTVKNIIIDFLYSCASSLFPPPPVLFLVDSLYTFLALFPFLILRLNYCHYNTHYYITSFIFWPTNCCINSNQNFIISFLLPFFSQWVTPYTKPTNEPKKKKEISLLVFFFVFFSFTSFLGIGLFRWFLSSFKLCLSCFWYYYCYCYYQG